MVLHNRLWFYIMDYVKSIISEIIPGFWTLWTNYEHYEVPKPLMVVAGESGVAGEWWRGSAEATEKRWQVAQRSGG